MGEVFIKDNAINVKVGATTYRYEVKEGIEVHGVTANNEDQKNNFLIVGCHKDSEGMKTPILWCLDGTVYTGTSSFCLTPYKELKDCPFCGHKPRLEHDNASNYNALCDFMQGGCGARGGVRYDKSEAIKAWNKRA